MSTPSQTAPPEVADIATTEAFRRRVESLEAQLREAHETLEAIQGGEVDAVVVGGPGGDTQIYTLKDADRPYRMLIERMREGAVTLNRDGVVLYCNRALTDLVGAPAEHIVGHSLRKVLAGSPSRRRAFDRLLAGGDGKGEFVLATADGTARLVPMQVSFSRLPDVDGDHAIMCAVVTDLTEEKRQAAAMAEVHGRLAAEAARAEGEGFARLILESATDFAIIATDTAKRITTWNSGAETIFGWTSADVLGRPMPPIWTPEDRQAGASEAEMRGALERGRAEDERWHLRQDGSRFWANGLMMPLRGSDDRHLGFLKILRDRTAARLAEEDRIAAARQLGALVETQRVVDRAGADLDAVMDAVVRGALTILPRADGAVVEMREGDAVVYRAAAGTSAPYVGLRLKIEGSFSGLCLQHGRPLLCADSEADGRVDREACRRVGVVSMITVPVPHHGEYVAVLKVHAKQAGALLEADIPLAQLLVGALVAGLSGVAEAQAAAALSASEERLRFAQEAGGIGTFEWDLADGTIAMSDTFRRLWGVVQPVLPHRVLADLVLPDDRERVGSLRGETGAEALAYTEYRIRRPDTGDIRWIARRGEVIDGPDGRPIRGFGIVYDITEQKAREAALADLNATLEQRVAERTADRDRMWRLSSDIMLVARFDATIVAVNPAWTSLLGWREDELLGRSLLDLVHADDAERTRAETSRLSDGRTTLRFENRYRHKDGSHSWVAWTAVPDAEFIHAVGRDVTEEKAAQAALSQTQEALRQAQKMEAVGQLTGGIAHDFNNLLTGILGSLDLMQIRIRQGRTDMIERYATAAMSSASRAAALTHRLLAFARRQPLDARPTDANALVSGMEDLLRRTLTERVQLDIVTAGGLWLTRCDPHQLENGVLNLAINARDAMPGGGRLTIETANAHLDHAYARRHADVSPGHYVCITVTDTGEGMPPDVIAKAFDPFFTTKPIGQGTGLGLSMIYGFAKQSDGHVRIYSEVGKGTAVKIFLPRHRGDADDEPIEASRQSQSAARGETVLVVEDEHIVRGLVVEVLETMGCRVIEASDGPAGLALLRQRQRIDLLISDVGLPGLNGRQLAEQAREQRPDLKVLFITGYAENAMFLHGHLETGMEMITKPFSIDVLTQRVQHMLGP